MSYCQLSLPENYKIVLQLALDSFICIRNNDWRIYLYDLHSYTESSDKFRNALVHVSPHYQNIYNFDWYKNIGLLDILFKTQFSYLQFTAQELRLLTTILQEYTAIRAGDFELLVYSLYREHCIFTGTELPNMRDGIIRFTSAYSALLTKHCIDYTNIVNDICQLICECALGPEIMPEDELHRRKMLDLPTIEMI